MEGVVVDARLFACYKCFGEVHVEKVVFDASVDLLKILWIINQLVTG